MKHLALAIEHIERDHGGCQDNTCNISIALRHGYNLVAIDGWIGSGAAAPDFPIKKIPFKAWQKECALMCKELPHFECPHCNAVIWLPEETNYYCDSCGKVAKQ